MSVDGWLDIFTVTNLEYLGRGLLMSLGLAGATALFGLILGSLMAVWSFSVRPPWNLVPAVYVALFRHIPLLVLAFFLAFGLPVAGINISPVVAGLIAMTINNTAYVSEALRGALDSVNRGQLDAALSTGLTVWTANRLVVYPQGLFRAIPVLVGQSIVTVQGTALLSALGIADLTLRSTNLASRLGNPLEMTLLLGVIYYLVDKTLAVARVIMERKVAARMIA